MGFCGKILHCVQNDKKSPERISFRGLLFLFSLLLLPVREQRQRL